MNSGTFHVTAQEWRYYSREKALIHTLHLAELPTFRPGDPVYIVPVPPTGTGNNNGFNVGPLSVPDITPYKDVKFLGTTGYIPTPYGAISDSAGILDGHGDFYTARMAGVPNPPPFAPNVHNVSFAVPGRGGMVLAYSHAIQAFQPILMGLQNPESEGMTIFTSDWPGSVNPSPSLYPPGHYTPIHKFEVVMFGSGPDWSTIPDMLLFVINPNTESLILVDNLATGSVSYPSKVVGSEPYPVYPQVDWFPTTFIEAIRLGELNE